VSSDLQRDNSIALCFLTKERFGVCVCVCVCVRVSASVTVACGLPSGTSLILQCSAMVKRNKVHARS
jgi:hypothetical protein